MGQQPRGVPEQPRLVPIEQRGERELVALAYPVPQPGVVFIHTS